MENQERDPDIFGGGVTEGSLDNNRSESMDFMHDRDSSDSMELPPLPRPDVWDEEAEIAKIKEAAERDPRILWKHVPKASLSDSQMESTYRSGSDSMELPPLPRPGVWDEEAEIAKIREAAERDPSILRKHVPKASFGKNSTSSSNQTLIHHKKDSSLLQSKQALLSEPSSMMSTRPPAGPLALEQESFSLANATMLPKLSTAEGRKDSSSKLETQPSNGPSQVEQQPPAETTMVRTHSAADGCKDSSSQLQSQPSYGSLYVENDSLAKTTMLRKLSRPEGHKDSSSKLQSQPSCGSLNVEQDSLAKTTVLHKLSRPERRKDSSSKLEVLLSYVPLKTVERQPPAETMMLRKPSTAEGRKDSLSKLETQPSYGPSQGEQQPRAENTMSRTHSKAEGRKNSSSKFETQPSYGPLQVEQQPSAETMTLRKPSTAEGRKVSSFKLQTQPDEELIPVEQEVPANTTMSNRSSITVRSHSCKDSSAILRSKSFDGPKSTIDNVLPLGKRVLRSHSKAERNGTHEGSSPVAGSSRSLMKLPPKMPEKAESSKKSETSSAKPPKGQTVSSRKRRDSWGPECRRLQGGELTPILLNKNKLSKEVLTEIATECLEDRKLTEKELDDLSMNMNTFIEELFNSLSDETPLAYGVFGFQALLEALISEGVLPSETKKDDLIKLIKESCSSEKEFEEASTYLYPPSTWRDNSDADTLEYFDVA